ncbi:hypothetical protein ACH5RR_026669 [Cinchona calisaya]|uniref:Leucine-rich repeat-containing N-terminal plant-type domain-containing protein n=1 Tax=Cinchona calisaya TaxID=153742 RepID=A0ABD2Z6E1_9GENT
MSSLPNHEKPFSKHLFLILIISFFTLKIASASVDEAEALLTWKASFTNMNNTLLKSWKSSNHSKGSVSPCTWLGVSCINGSINRLNITNSSINGTLHSFPFSSLPNLEYANLSMNQLSGSIPPQISKLSKLINYLDLSYNQFSGSITPEIGLLTNL